MRKKRGENPKEHQMYEYIHTQRRFEKEQSKRLRKNKSRKKSSVKGEKSCYARVGNNAKLP